MNLKKKYKQNKTILPRRTHNTAELQNNLA